MRLDREALAVEPQSRSRVSRCRPALRRCGVRGLALHTSICQKARYETWPVHTGLPSGPAICFQLSSTSLTTVAASARSRAARPAARRSCRPSRRSRAPRLRALRLRLLLVHQDEARAGDRPALLAAADRSAAGRSPAPSTNRHWPPRPGSSCARARRTAPSLFFSLRVGHLVLQRIGVFDIADGARGAATPARRRLRCPCRRARRAIRPRCSRRPSPSTRGSPSTGSR